MSTILSINVSPIVTVERDGKTVRTGIFKKPVLMPTMIGELGLAGDAQADKRHHGGPHMAVYFYPAQHYTAFRKELAKDLPYGTFGENLTITELDEESIHIGDELEIGRPGGAGGDAAVRVVVTSPRMPCSTLAMAMESTQFVKQFLESGRLGWYGRVLHTGVVRTGDEIRVVHRDPAKVSILSIARLRKNPKASESELRNAAKAASLHPEWREMITTKLEALARG
ncbi:MAG: MOSC domain-containing protein [Phycisphaerales bacterium]|nr:MOSC domain-containing protein [Phycisphaerales bacterium]